MPPRRNYQQTRITKKRRTRKSSRLACKGKVRFRDKQEADRALKHIANHDAREKTPTRSYFCESCKGWHHSSKATHARAGIDSADSYDQNRSRVKRAASLRDALDEYERDVEADLKELEAMVEHEHDI
jgi:hypothetical protein